MNKEVCKVLDDLHTKRLEAWERRLNALSWEEWVKAQNDMNEARDAIALIKKIYELD